MGYGFPLCCHSIIFHLIIFKGAFIVLLESGVFSFSTVIRGEEFLFLPRPFS